MKTTEEKRREMIRLLAVLGFVPFMVALLADAICCGRRVFWAYFIAFWRKEWRAYVRVVKTGVLWE